ncbi:hypothetical protein PCANC_28706 [Puccinia coronata f. sp. avenae]|uniref:Uncharacterized protein n=1 Tax=Puccinia coronata f. sp. avenae TaxID=200324 RepID=A0A2N5S163_9BASI|nr:hypothetical protein PCANC_28706 [Puccinia coronata f. sp. avenae]
MFQLVPSSPTAQTLLPLSDLPETKPEATSSSLLSLSRKLSLLSRVEAAQLLLTKPPLIGQRHPAQLAHPTLKGVHLQGQPV